MTVSYAIGRGSHLPSRPKSTAMKHHFGWNARRVTEQVLATRSVSITELKRSPSAVLEQAGSEPVAVLNHNRPAAYLLPPHVYEAMLERLNADLRVTIHEGIAAAKASPPRTYSPSSYPLRRTACNKTATKTRGKRST